MTIEELKIKYPKDEEYLNPFISNLQLYIHLSEYNRKFLYQETLKEFKRFKEETENKMKNMDDQIEFDYYGQFLVKINNLIDTLKNDETKWELTYWLFNNGKFRSQEEIQNRKDIYAYTSEKFQKKLHSHNDWHVGSYLLGLTAWIWIPVILGIFDPELLVLIFYNAFLSPVLIPLGIIISSGLFYINSKQDKEFNRIKNKFEQSNSLTIAKSFTTGFVIAKYFSKNSNKGWINK